MTSEHIETAVGPDGLSPSEVVRRGEPGSRSRESEPGTAEDEEPPGFVECLLRDDEWLDGAVMNTDGRPETLRRFILVAVAGLLLHGVVVGLVSRFVVTYDGFGAQAWYAASGAPAAVPAALVGAFLTAVAVGLPCFYFYARLAGADVSFPVVVGQSLRALAQTSVALWAILPFYTAVVLSSQLGVAHDVAVVRWGLGLPFVAGLYGIRSVYRSFRRLVDGEDASEGLRLVEHSRRAGLLGMVLAWGALFTAVAPIALWRYGAYLAQWSL